MGTDKQILKQLEKDAKRVYEILLEMLKAIKEAIDILKRKKSPELKDAISAYIMSYAHARGLRIILVTLHESIQQDAEFERRLKAEEDSLDQLIKQHKIRVQSSLRQNCEFHQRWLDMEIPEMSKYQRINSRFSGMLMFYGGGGIFGEKPDVEGSKNDYSRMVASLNRMGLKDIRYRILACTTEIITIQRRIVKLIGANRSQRVRVDLFLKESVLPDFRTEVALLEKEVVDRYLIQHSKKLKRHLQELEALV